MSIIDLFISLYGQKKADEILQYMEKYEILDEFNNCENIESKLFFFSVKYGIIDIVKFLYEKLNIEYDYDILYRFNITLDSNEMISTKLLIPLNSSSVEGKMLNLIQSDKFSKNRNLCISYLIDMKKYSRLSFKNKKFYYKYIK
ncbi:hypothetical protein Indivirus_9_11 [Indivirus ILV1]|uniref:Uncharacterized protein n=1 Tax=Indivirus ILV1 TaxID=1977633 RepID=A0A1V0SEI3_9VIRU|nr:hypothetical protein Indivirus_9_11 [Indivirus ILV1]